MPVTVRYLADTKDVVSGSKTAADAIEGVGKAAEGAGQQAGGFKGALADVSKVAGGFVIGTAITQAPGFLMDAAKAAAEDEQATIRLEQSLRNATGSFDDNLAKVNDRIDAGADLVFADDDIRNSFQQLLVATDDVDEALRRQTVAMDLARGTGMSLEQASKLVGKVNEENVDQFKKLGIEIKDGASEQEALAAVQAKFAGQADAYASSSAAQMEKFDQQMGELQETLGTALLPVLAAVGTILTTVLVPTLATIAEDIAPQISAVLVPAIDGISMAFQALQPYLLPLAALFGGVALGIMAALVPAMVTWTAATWAQVAALIAQGVAFVTANAPIIAIGLAIGALIAVVILIIQHWDTIVAKVPALGVALDAVKTVIDAVVKWITEEFIPGFLKLYTAVETTVTDTVKFVSDHWHEIEDIIRPAVEILVALITTQFEIIKTIITTAIEVAIGIVNTAIAIFKGDWDTAWNEIKGIVFDIWEGIKGIIGTAIDFLTTDLVPKMLTAAKALATAFKDGFVEALKGSIGLGNAVANALAGVIESAVNSVIDKVNGAFQFKITNPVGPDVDINPPDIQHIHIPRLAAGGIVTGPTVAQIGEAGAEAVIPLEGANPVTDALQELVTWEEREAMFHEQWVQQYWETKEWQMYTLEQEGYQTSLLQAVVSHLMDYRHEFALADIADVESRRVAAFYDQENQKQMSVVTGLLSKIHSALENLGAATAASSTNLLGGLADLLKQLGQDEWAAA